MTKSSEPKADRLNYAEIKRNSVQSLEGGSPRSIRTCGYHRAIKRGESWALLQEAIIKMINQFNIDFYQNTVTGSLVFGKQMTKLEVNTDGLVKFILLDFKGKTIDDQSVALPTENVAIRPSFVRNIAQRFLKLFR